MTLLYKVFLHLISIFLSDEHEKEAMNNIIYITFVFQFWISFFSRVLPFRNWKVNAKFNYWANKW